MYWLCCYEIKCFFLYFLPIFATTIQSECLKIITTALSFLQHVEKIASAQAEKIETMTLTDEHDEQNAACIEPQATVACTTTNTFPTSMASTCSSKAKASNQAI